MFRALRWAAPLGVAAVTTLALATLATSGSAAPRPARADRADRGATFGDTTVRSGIPAGVPRFRLTSPDVRADHEFPVTNWADSMGCTGGNHAPRLDWSGAPAGTRSFAVTMFDPDAPTGGGFWHWITWDIPAGARSLTATLPAGTVSGTNSAGVVGYQGPCPPAGDRTHGYQLTVVALDVPSLALPAATPPAITAFTMGGHVIGYARLTVPARQP